MSYLIDTNVLSELVKTVPNARVIAWFKEIDESNLFISTLTIGELRKGIEKLVDKNKKTKLIVWLEQELISRFTDRILSIDIKVAERWGRLLAESQQTLPAIDSLIAATALHHDLYLATRNVDDFHITGLEIFNPWNW